MRAILGGLAAAMVAAGAAEAAITVYYHAGSWHAFSGTDSQNQIICGIGTENRADGRSLDLTFVIGGDTLFFQASKPSWSIPNGTQVPVAMQIGPYQPWNEQATGNGTMLSWSIPRDQISPFDGQFRAASSMTLGFPSGSEPPWTISLVGSTAADNTFARCITDLTHREQPQQSAAPTQPFGQGQATAGGAPTQPFGQGGSAAPTQPQPAQPQPTPPQPTQPHTTQ
jgi:hypothetical protein